MSQDIQPNIPHPQKRPSSNGAVWPLIFLFIIVAVVSALGFFRGNPFVSEDGSINRGAIEEIVAEYIANNPEAIIKSVENMQKRQAQQQTANVQQTLEANKDKIFNDPTSPVIGNPDGDVTVVEFFDYSCGFCKRAFPTVAKLIQEDDNIRLVMKEFPILGPSSEIAARAAMAAHIIDPDKYYAFHSAILSGRVTDKNSVLAIAESVGLDREKLAVEMEKDSVANILKENRALARSLGINGTPAFIIGDKIIPGAVSYEQLAQQVKEVRNNQ